MKFKIAQPEDYPELPFSFALSKAYARVESDFLTTLMTFNSVIHVYENDAMKSAEDTEWLINHLKNKLKEFELTE